jgi:prepilin-type N-terminal cleavage/methylation domain-containing protein
MQRRNGFTLIEITIAVVILMVVLLVAVPSLTGVLADRRLRKSLDDMNRLVFQAQEHSMKERRPYLIVWRNKQFALRPEGFVRGEDRKPIATLNFQKGESFKLSFPAAIEEEPPSEWIFWPSGNCEPAVVTYRGASGAWKAKYSALTARPELLNYAVR